MKSYNWNPTGFIMWEIQIILSKNQSRMARRNAPKRIPLNNNNREIVKAGIYQCCGNEWMRPYYEDCVKICNQCEEIVNPIRWNEEWRKRWFGHFKCTAKTGKSKKPCGRTWSSSWTWTVDNQIQTTECKTCNSSTMPYQLVS